MEIGLTREKFDWLLENLASPAAPLVWFEKLQPGSGLARQLVRELKYLTLALWAAGFVWLWFLLFVVLFLYEGLGLAPWTHTTKAAPPAAPQR